MAMTELELNPPVQTVVQTPAPAPAPAPATKTSSYFGMSPIVPIAASAAALLLFAMLRR